MIGVKVNKLGEGHVDEGLERGRREAEVGLAGKGQLHHGMKSLYKLYRPRVVVLNEVGVDGLLTGKVAGQQEVARVASQLLHSHLNEKAERFGAREVGKVPGPDEVSYDTGHAALVARIDERPDFLGEDGTEDQAEAVGQLGVGLGLGEDAPQHISDVHILPGFKTQHILRFRILTNKINIKAKHSIFAKNLPYIRHLPSRRSKLPHLRPTFYVYLKHKSTTAGLLNMFRGATG